MRRTAACLLFCFLALLTVTTAAAAPPPQAKKGGADLSEWAKRFFVFDASIPVVNGSHPALDVGDVDCSLGQSGKVWFLETAPGIPGDFERRCSIPSGTKLYVPVFQWFCAPELDGIPVADCLVDADAAFADIDVGLTVDGNTLDHRGADAYRAEESTPSTSRSAEEGRPGVGQPASSSTTRSVSAPTSSACSSTHSLWVRTRSLSPTAPRRSGSRAQ